MTTDRIEPFVRVDIAALRTKLQAEVFVSLDKGMELAEAHSAIVQDFIEANGFAVGDDFWAEMSEKARVAIGGDPIVDAAYAIITTRFRAAVAEANPLEITALEHDIASRRAEAKPEGDDDESAPFDLVDVNAIAGPDGEAIIDRMAAQHGHLTREDECEGIQMLRSLRERLTNPDADGA